MLRLFAFGVLDLQGADGGSLPKPPTLKSQSLLVYLAVRPTRHAREQICGMFWGERPERKARRSLSTALWHIRRCLPDEYSYIVAEGDTVQFNPNAPFWLDAAVFADYATRTDIGSLQSAVTLYQGPFLEGFYDEWIVTERYRLEGIYLDVLARLMAAQESAGLLADALATAAQLLDADPLREGAHRVAMRAYCQLGQRAAALQQYERCQTVLRQELDVAPLEETRRLRDAIRAERCVARGVQSVGAVPAPLQRRRGQGYDPREARRFPLVGRDEELARLDAAWRQAVSHTCSLLLISGVAGIGKTRLLQAFVDRQRWHAVRVLTGRCYAFERQLPYQSFVEALRCLPADLIASVSAELPVWAREQVARLLPDYDVYQTEPLPPEAPPGTEQAKTVRWRHPFLDRTCGERTATHCSGRPSLGGRFHTAAASLHGPAALRPPIAHRWYGSC